MMLRKSFRRRTADIDKNSLKAPPSPNTTLHRISKEEKKRNSATMMCIKFTAFDPHKVRM